VSRFLLSCGGTGGHLAPGIALAEALVDRGHRVKLLISRKQVDARLIEKYPHLDFVRISGAGLSANPRALARFVVQQASGFWSGARLVRSFRPDAVVGFGGFTSAAFIAAGALLGVPVVLHEANRVPGRAIRVLGRFALRVYLPPGVGLAGVRAEAIREVGLPVRREFQREPAATAREALGLESGQRVVVILGGSQGASPLNDWVRRELPLLAAEGIQTYCVTGLGKGAPETLTLRSREGHTVRAVFAAFSDRMSRVLSAADLAVSRAGAGTLAELIRAETPAVLVPYPQAADNHQAANAAAFVHGGGGRLVPQERLGDLTSHVLELLADDDALAAHRACLRQLDRADALGLMVGDLEAIAQTRKGQPPVADGTLTEAA